MKKILLIGTGGTIASKKTIDGLAPGLDANELLASLDDITDICEVSTIELSNLDSTNIRYENWKAMAECIKDNYDLYDGFVITHGTDTMAYSVAALSYMIQNSRKPIVFTGSQKSIFMRDTDARNNLTNALVFASDSRSNGVVLVFDDKAILGTRAKKNRTKSYNAFSSVNYPEIARICDKKVNFYIENYPKEEVKFYLNFNTKVFSLKLIPGMDPGILDYIVDKYDAIILESYGVGGIPMYLEEEFIKFLEKIFLLNKTIVITTQVPYEGSDMKTYSVGRRIKEKFNLLEGYDMTIEALVCKLMWIGGNVSSHKDVRRLLYTPINKDITVFD